VRHEALCHVAVVLALGGDESSVQMQHRQEFRRRVLNMPPRGRDVHLGRGWMRECAEADQPTRLEGVGVLENGC